MYGRTVGEIIKSGGRLPAGLKRFDGEIFHLVADQISRKTANEIAQEYRNRSHYARVTKLDGKWAVWTRR